MKGKVVGKISPFGGGSNCRRHAEPHTLKKYSDSEVLPQLMFKFGFKSIDYLL